MKILYAADNRIGSHVQLKRFLAAIKHKSHQIKIAAYRISTKDINVDYTLDALLNFSNPTEFFTINDNYTYYCNEIKRFAPDIIVSDLEVYTSHIALELGIKCIQASPILMYYALPHEIKYNSGINKNNASILNSDDKRRSHIINMINSSDKKLVISHICDTNVPIKLNDGFRYVRPDFVLAEVSSNPKFDILAVMSSYTDDKLKKLMHKDIEPMTYDMIDYNYNYLLDSCNIHLNEGMEVFLSDAFYNSKYSITIPKPDDFEAIVCSYVNQICGLGSITTINNLDIQKKPFDIVIDDNVKFLSQEIEIP